MLASVVHDKRLLSYEVLVLRLADRFFALLCGNPGQNLKRKFVESLVRSNVMQVLAVCICT